MKIKSLASGSSGNAYMVDWGTEGPVFLLEAGLSFNKLQQKIWSAGYKLSGVDLCLISHQHF